MAGYPFASRMLKMKKPVSFLGKTATLFGIPAIALAQSKSPGTPTIPTGSAVVPEASVLSGSISVTGSNSNTLGDASFTLTPTKWETSTTPAAPTCTISGGSSMTTSKSGAASNTSSTGNYTYSCSLGSLTKNTTYNISGLTAGAWSGAESAYALPVSSVDLSTLPSSSQQVSSGKSGKSGSSSTQRTYTLNLAVTKSGFSFDEKVKKAILCAEQVAGVVFNVNTTPPTASSSATQPAGTTTHYAATSTVPELAVAYYTSGWQFAIAGPRPGKTIFRTPESAQSALSRKTVTSNTSMGKSSTPTTSTVITDDLSKGWYDLAPLETLNSAYCKAW